MTRIDSILIGLVRAALGGDRAGGAECGRIGAEELGSLGEREWGELVDLAFEGGVDAISADGYQRLIAVNPAESLLDTEKLEGLRMEWLSSVFQCEDDYARHRAAIASLAKAYADRGIEMMVLKGYGLSLNYPVPSHRHPGDIDVYLFGKWREADELVAGRGVSIDYGHHHHSVFRWGGEAVENHYDIVNRYADKAGRALDDCLKELALKERRSVVVDGVAVYLPSATFNGVFLMWHSAAHFSGYRITLRHLLDWALFVEHDWAEIDWPVVLDWAGRTGHLRFLSCLNGLCVSALGMAAERFPALERDPALEERVLRDILHPSFDPEHPSFGSGLHPSCKGAGHLLAQGAGHRQAQGTGHRQAHKGAGRGFLFKLRRLRANMWKRRLVASEAFVPRMARLAWSHLVRPEKVLPR